MRIDGGAVYGEEQTVLNVVVDGLSNREIGNQMGRVTLAARTERAAEHRTRAILTKYGL